MGSRSYGLELLDKRHGETNGEYELIVSWQAPRGTVAAQVTLVCFIDPDTYEVALAEVVPGVWIDEEGDDSVPLFVEAMPVDEDLFDLVADWLAEDMLEAKRERSIP